MTPVSRRRLSLLIVPLALLLALDANAAPLGDRGKAQALYDSGMTHYNLGEIDAALADFTAGYRAYRDASFLYNIAQCHRRLRHFAEAADFYRTYEREFTGVANRPELDRMIAEMDRAAAEQREQERQQRQQEQQQQQEPSQETQKAPLPTETKPTPAEKAPGPQLVVAHETPPPRKPLYKRWWLWTAVGVVAAGAAVGVGLGVGLRGTTGNVFSPTTIP